MQPMQGGIERQTLKTAAEMCELFSRTEGGGGELKAMDDEWPRENHEGCERKCEFARIKGLRRR